jgi:hypothetical protein
MKWVALSAGIAFVAICAFVQASYDEEGKPTSGWQLWVRLFLYLLF